jgi:hypothetical protein
VHRLQERLCLNREAAEQRVRAWFSGPDLPRDMVTSASGVEVGPPVRFPFLRQKGAGKDGFAPLGALSHPDLLLLTGVPADLEPLGSAEEGERATVATVPIDPDILRARMAEVAGGPEASESADPGPLPHAAGRRKTGVGTGVREIYLEDRVFFPVRYSFGGSRYTAVVSGGTGAVLAARRPPRPQILGERLVAPPVAAILFMEALLVPGLAGKVAAISLSGVLAFFLARWLVARHV